MPKKASENYVTRQDLEEVVGGAVAEVLAVISDRFTGVESRLEKVEHRLDKVETGLDTLTARMESIDRKLDVTIALQNKHSNDIAALQRKLRLKAA